MPTSGFTLYLVVIALFAFVAVLAVVLRAMRSSRRRRAEEAALDISSQLGEFEPGGGTLSVLPGRAAASPPKYGAWTNSPGEPGEHGEHGEHGGYDEPYVEQGGHGGYGDPYVGERYAEAAPEVPADVVGSAGPALPEAVVPDTHSWARADAITWLAHRAHTCAERQLDFLHEARTASSGAHSTAARDLFPLEHLANQARRAIDGVLVLAGDPAYRSYIRPVPLSEVVRTAALSLPSFDRVDLDLEEDPHVREDAAAALSHLLAEVLDPLLQNRTRAVVACTRARDGFEVVLTDEDAETGEPPKDGMTDEDLRRGMSWLVHPSGSPERPEDLAFAVAGEVARELRLSVRLGRGWDGASVITVPLPAHVVVGQETERAPASAPRQAQETPPAVPAQGAVPASAPAKTEAAPVGLFGGVPHGSQAAAPVAGAFGAERPAVAGGTAAAHQPVDSPLAQHSPWGAVTEQAPASAQSLGSPEAVEPPVAVPPSRPLLPQSTDVLPGRPSGLSLAAGSDAGTEEDDEGGRTGRKRRRGPRKRKSADAQTGEAQTPAAPPEAPAPPVTGPVADVLPGRAFPEQRARTHPQSQPQDEPQSQQAPQYQGAPQHHDGPQHHDDPRSQQAPQHQGAPQHHAAPQHHDDPRSRQAPQHQGAPQHQAGPHQAGPHHAAPHHAAPHHAAPHHAAPQTEQAPQHHGPPQTAPHAAPAKSRPPEHTHGVVPVGVPVGVGATAAGPQQLRRTESTPEFASEIAPGPGPQANARPTDSPQRESVPDPGALPQFSTGGAEGPRGSSFAPLPASPVDAPPAPHVGGGSAFATREEPGRFDPAPAGPTGGGSDTAPVEDATAALSELSRLFGGEEDGTAGGDGKAGVPGQRSG